MTTDFIQHHEALKQPKRFGLKPSNTSKRAVGGRIELTRNDSFVDGAQDIFDILAEHSAADDNLKQSIGKTLTFLQKAKQKLENAEKKINAQQSRIHQLETLSITDELTGLNNRAGLETILMRELARTKRQPENAGILVMVDIESYDAVKAQHGEDAAKAGLKLVGRILNEEIRTMDAAARVSESEFVLLFTNAAADKVLERVQKLALKINNLSTIWDKQEIKTHASLRLRAYGPHDTIQGLLPPAEESAST